MPIFVFIRRFYVVVEVAHLTSTNVGLKATALIAQDVMPRFKGLLIQLTISCGSLNLSYQLKPGRVLIIEALALKLNRRLDFEDRPNCFRYFLSMPFSL